MSRKSTLSALFAARPLASDGPQGAPAPPDALEVKSSEIRPLEPLTAVNSETPGGRVRSGAIGAMGASLQHLTDAAREADDLRRRLATADTIVEIDPELILPSLVNDRLGQAFDPDFERLKASIEADGQQVPVLLRPHPERAGRYQVAYGHRRVRALRALRRPVRAQVRALSDAELVVAQGRENLERRDLSYAERAYFAANLQEAGHERAVIMAALGVDKTELSRLIALGEALPAHLLQGIGPAPKIGRPRWLELIEAHRRPGADERCRILMLKGVFADAPSDRRFLLMLEAAKGQGSVKKPRILPRILLKSAGGEPLVKAAAGTGTTRLELDDRLAPDFAAFLAARLPELYDEYRAAEPRAPEPASVKGR